MDENAESVRMRLLFRHYLVWYILICLELQLEKDEHHFFMEEELVMVGNETRSAFCFFLKQYMLNKIFVSTICKTGSGWNFTKFCPFVILKNYIQNFKVDFNIKFEWTFMQIKFNIVSLRIDCCCEWNWVIMLFVIESSWKRNPFG